MTMSARCRWQLRLVEGALRRGDWQDARARVLAMEPGGCAGCAEQQACTARRGYLHGLALSVKIAGGDAARAALAGPDARAAQTANSASS